MMKRNKINKTFVFIRSIILNVNTWLIILTLIGLYLASQQGTIITQQTQLLNKSTQLLNLSVKQGEPDIIPTGYCKYDWYLYGGYNQTFSIIDVGKTPGTVTLSYASANMFLTIYQNASVGIYGQNALLQILPNTPFTFKLEGAPRISLNNRSYMNYSIRILTNGTSFGRDFNNCYILTCSYTNNTPVAATGNNYNNIPFMQIKNVYLYNALQYNNGYFYSTNETWVKENSTSSCNVPFCPNGYSFSSDGECYQYS